MALTPDGGAVIFAGVKGGRMQLFLRRFDQPLATPIAGTDGAVGPFLSPDGQWIGFWADNKVKKVPLAGGPPTSLCDASSIRGLFGATWGSHGTIVFSTSFGPNGPSGVGLIKVSAAGGTPQPLTTPDAGNKEVRHLLPAWLPDERAILYTVATSTDLNSGTRIVAQTIASGERHVIVEDATDPRYLPSGQLLYMKLGVLMAAPFDATKLQVTGPAAAMLDGVMQSMYVPNGAVDTGMAQFAISPAGHLAYATGGISPPFLNTIIRVDRKGVEQELKVPKDQYLGARVSPDGQKVVVTKTGGSSDIWLVEIGSGNLTRLTSDSGSAWPLWSPDGKRILF